MHTGIGIHVVHSIRDNLDQVPDCDRDHVGGGRGGGGDENVSGVGSSGNAAKKRKKGPAVVAQKYLMPMLAAGNKFDLRVHILVASTDPFVVFWRPGVVKRSLVPYDHYAPFGPDTIAMHLTNSHKQLKQPNFSAADHLWNIIQLAEDIASQGKMTKQEFISSFRNFSMWAASAVFNAHKHNLVRHPGSWQMVGLDMMVDSEGNFYLLELNLCPGMFGLTDWNEEMRVSTIVEGVKLVLGIQSGKLQLYDTYYSQPVFEVNNFVWNWELLWDERWGVEIVNPRDDMHSPCPCNPKPNRPCVWEYYPTPL
eukprot:TRINITY_DN58920_c0_g1_i1.p1 TRINITY_DN58920_c0_g1~~TRINITY_DN58920_c0_g1_i1.p1  ORF type:complete len:309 (-),score=46.36 TRINITY_DN58920_c0_g1_i1:41-967(-)